MPRTPYDRVLEAEEVPAARKARLRRQYRALDPVDLLDAMKRLQDELWALGYRELPSRRGRVPSEPMELIPVDPPAPAPPDEPRTYHKMRRRHKKHKKHKAYVHWWRTCPDAFESVWRECETDLKEQPNLSAAALLRRLQARHPGEYKASQLRTLQRRVRAWRLAQLKEPLPPRLRGDSLPEKHQIELVVPYPRPFAEEPLRYGFE